MSYRVEIKVVIYAETRQVAESFAAMVETYVGESFTPETAVYTARIEQPLDADGKAQRTSPADLVGALQDVVHTDPGPVRAGKAHRDAFSEFVCPNHGRVQQLTDSGDCPMCYQDRHAQRTSE